MCGIVGYVGKDPAAPYLLDGLYRLEYRGYDSAGIALQEGGKITVVRRKGRVKELECARGMSGSVGIGHTRWATHGEPSEENAHPHRYKDVVLVHNGIIENAYSLKKELCERGEIFSSETDSEVIAHLVADGYRGDLLEAVKGACARLEGSFALAVMCVEEGGTIVCARRKSPLIAAKGEALFVSSDLSALAGKRVKAYALGEDEFAVLRGESIRFFDSSLSPIPKSPLETVEEEPLARGGYPHDMRREMAEIPAAIALSQAEFERNFRNLPICEVLCHTEYIQIVACGTAYHAGLCAKRFIERYARVPVEVFVASEYRYLDPIVKENTVALAISQSGETADTLAASQLAMEKGARLIAVTNVPASSITRLTENVVFTRAGREIAVAATKSFNAQLVALYLFARELAMQRGKFVPAPPDLSSLAETVLARSLRAGEWAKRFVRANVALFVGRGADSAVALEGSLKLKEISYLPSEGYPAGELKHGTLALVEKGTPVVAVITEKALAEKTMNAVHEARARGAEVFVVTSFPAYATERDILLPPCDEGYAPVLSVIPLQMLAYFVALARGADPDRPRNLAKSVTVE